MKKILDIVDPVQLKVTVIIPVYEQIHKLPATLDSINSQVHTNLDCLLLVKESSDELLSLVSTWMDKVNVEIYTLETSNFSKVFNRGVMLSTGYYVQLMMPGERYVSAHSLMKMVACALESFLPHMVYMGALLEYENSEIEPKYDGYELSNLKKGITPTLLSACLIRRDMLLKEGMLENYSRSASELDWFCRMKKLPYFQFVCEEYYAIESPVLEQKAQKMVKNAFDTAVVIHRHFSFFAACLNWLKQRPFWRFFKWMSRFYRSKITFFSR